MKPKEMQPLRGRHTIRKNGSITGATGQTSRLIKRWGFDPKPNTLLAQLEQAYWVGLDSVDSLDARTLSNAANGKFTPEGVKDDALSFALNGLIPNLHKARMTIKRAKAEVAERVSKLKIEAPDKSDVAAAFRRQEIRDLMREMQDGEKREYFAKYGVDLPAEVTAAVLEMPAEFSGVPPDRHEQLRKSVLTAQYGQTIAETAELEEAISAAESAVETGRDEIRLMVGGIDKQKWDELAAPIEARHAAPWLRRRGGEVYVVDLDRRVERKPSDEELACGIFANTHDEYLREQTTVAAGV
jgi:hypothetical protein